METVKYRGVLILILLENALRRSLYRSYLENDEFVLILILLENALRQIRVFAAYAGSSVVLILILLENALRPAKNKILN